MMSTQSAPQPPRRPAVGVGAIVTNDKGEVLVGKRKGSHGTGTWAFPGGHLEHGESWTDCAAREVLEETGLEVTVLPGHVALTNDIFPDQEKHYITVIVACRMNNPKALAQNMEKHKCDGWEWFTWDELKDPKDEMTLFLPTANLVQEYPNIGDKVQRMLKND